METETIEEIFKQTCRKFLQISSEDIIQQLWEEIYQYYTESHRAYHTLQHISELIKHYEAIASAIQCEEVFLFTLFYHDIIYDPLSGRDNELDSAKLMAERLGPYSSTETVQRVYDYILATKSHMNIPEKYQDDSDLLLFLDIDLLILAASAARYEEYCRQVRKEYFMYDELSFTKGRLSVLKTFVATKPLFKSSIISVKYEEHARSNLTREISKLEYIIKDS